MRSLIKCVFCISIGAAGDMNACAIFIFMNIFLSECVVVHHYEQPNITSTYRTELKAIGIEASVGDIAVISAPVVKNAIYYLLNPNGDAIRLNITRPFYITNEQDINNQYDNIVIKYANNTKIMNPVNNYRVFNLQTKQDDVEDIFEEHENKMNANDFMIGPLVDEDIGNWVLSAYCKQNDDWIEIYQVVTIVITEYLPPKPRNPILREGDTFAFSFGYPIPNLMTCELTAPRSTFDRFYEKDLINMDSCGYIIRNLTKQDQGVWFIIGVGKIVYATEVYLKVLSQSDMDANLTNSNTEF